MTPQAAINALIEALNADKTMAQPWKNYALSDARRLQALIEKGATMTNQKPPEPVAQAPAICICTPGQKPHVSCPIHGLALP